MNNETYRQFRTLVYENSGITLGAGKEALVRSRVSKRMRTLGIPDERSYLDFVVSDRSGEEIVQLIDVISTNVTHFFREPQHFDLLHKHACELLEARQESIRVWSAACSTGPEAYSMAITLLEAGAACRKPVADMRILATDISTRVLSIARDGTYTSAELESVPAPLQSKYFKHSSVDTLTANDRVKQLITFRRLNLSQPPFPMKGPLDVVFCRNVMIYFDNAVRQRLISGIERLLRPGGLLMIGHSESLAGIETNLESIRPSVYRKLVAS